MSPAASRPPRIQPAASSAAKLAFAAVAVVVLAAPLLAEASAWLFTGEVAVPAELRAQRFDQPAPDFTLTDLDGRSVRLSDYRGKTVFLNFWATWCPPCVEEIPSMRTLARAMGSREFVVLAVSTDESIEDVRSFFGDDLPPFTVLMDEEQRVTQAYGTFKFPETYIISPDGRITAKFLGGRPWDGPAALAYFDRLTR